MNQAVSTPGADLLPETTDLFTAGHLALIAVLAVLVIAGLIWGIRNKARRRTAEHEVAEHNAEIRDGGELQRLDAPTFADDAGGFRPKNLSTAEANAPTELLFEPLPDMSARYADTPAAKEAVEEAPAEAPDAAPAADPVEVEPATTEPAPSHADGPVTQLKGLGPKLATRLADHGITTVGQLAALTDDEAAALDARLGPFTGRMGRDRWQEQARFLAAGDTKGFEAVFGRL